MDLSSIKRNTARINNGDWVDRLPGMEDLRLKVRGFSSHKYRDAVMERDRRISTENRGLRPPVLTAEEIDQADARLLVDVILIDWANVTSEGEAVPYSRATATKFLSDPDYEFFRLAVGHAARALDLLSTLPEVAFDVPKGSGGEADPALAA